MTSLSKTRRLSPKRLQQLTVLFVALVGIAILGLYAWHMAANRQLSLEVGQAKASSLARVAAREIEAGLVGADLIAAEGVKRIEQAGQDQVRLEKAYHWLQSRVAALPYLHDVRVYDKDGRLLMASPTASADLGAPDSRAFKHHAMHRDEESLIGSVISDPLAKSVKTTVSRRINSKTGQFAGAVLVKVQIDALAQFSAEYAIDAAAVELFLFEGKGPVVSLAWPAVELEASRTGPASHEGQLYATSPLHRYPLVVRITLPKQAVLAQWQRELYRSGLVIALVIIGLGVFGWVLIRQVQALVSAKQALRQAHDALEKLALHDALTGLANRRQLEVLLPAEIGRACRNALPLAVVMLDIDHFKRYNDLYGHPAGDECLRAVAQAVKTAIKRAGDLAVRYGGEEILVLLPGTDEAGAYQVAEKILQTIRALAIEHSGNTSGIVTASAGVYACFPKRDDVTPQALIKAADQALYIAKFSGRNKVHSGLINKISNLIQRSAA
ncbi:diguanylate cyclase [Pseudomonas duriflava]|uniref:diguanylate cyclase n=1 Tax=Pseudomonas duriflava TaxID=459528 RepID=A0A562PR57_9PSED|nr:diguanylate cyclase [Pseudomonas duriflava]TWI46868.1 diguanylate cyclase [Pseudomonas duriflava]